MTGSGIPKAALVTGGAKRLGRVIVEGLAEDGWAVAIHYGTSADEADALAAAITGNGGSAITVQADLADPAAPARMISEANAALGPLGLLVNSASLFEEDDARSLTAESFDAHMAVNLRSPLLLARQARKVGREQGLALLSPNPFQIQHSSRRVSDAERWSR